MIRIVDIFAGPGGLSEGFAAVRNEAGQPVFDISLSIEKDAAAYETLKLRSFFRYFMHSKVPDAYYRHLRGEIKRETLYTVNSIAAKKAAEKCWRAILGPKGTPAQEVTDRIHRVAGGNGDWVLIGGPPCQAYSIAGRSRNSGNPKYDAKKDIRNQLYIEYLQILTDNGPAVFIMENVKGLLSATIDNKRIFQRILEDLRNPAEALKREGRSARHCNRRYRIYSLVEHCEFKNGNIEGSVIKSELYGIPQARHRIILLGIREDLQGIKPKILGPQKKVPMSAVISSLPPLRSGLSRIPDSPESWENVLRSQENSRWANDGTSRAFGIELAEKIKRFNPHTYA